MKRFVQLTLLLLPVLQMLSAQDDPKARAILDKTAQTYKQSTCQIDFSLAIEDTKTENKQTIKGTVFMKDKKFKLTVPSIHTYYDGTTQYVHMIKNNEVSLTTPSLKDLQNINPTYILSSYTKQSSIQFSMDNNPALAYHIIDVFPDYQSKKDYYKVIVHIDKKTNNLTAIKVLNRNGIHSLLKVLNYKPNITLNDSFFVFDYKKNPTVLINDLR